MKTLAVKDVGIQNIVKARKPGIHHHCSKERLQGYLDEYHYRYNRRNNMDEFSIKTKIFID